MGNTLPLVLEPGYEKDKFVQLPDGRNLAYRTCGLTGGFPLFLLHGALGVGDFDRFSDDFTRLGYFAIAPTLPGWGQSSPLPQRTLRDWANDMIALAAHVIPGQERFDVLGISYGCVHALAVASQCGDRVRRCAVLGPHGPFDDPAYDPLVGMTGAGKMGLGALGNAIPALGKFTGWYVRRSTATPEDAGAFVQKVLVSAYTPTERAQYDALPADERDLSVMGRAMHASIALSLEGYAEIPRVLRSWSHRDLANIRCPLLVVGAEEDTAAPCHAARYIHAHVTPEPRLMIIPGGHMSLVMRFRDLLTEFSNLPVELAAPAAEPERLSRTDS